ncbi:1-aminocyclopropane-1-carboxylate synthase [Aureococcus anophagefferens]|nr:1-aminocyclopropane-1-carboxylate synthase [Aureococcus anophagefferens]
MPMPKASLKERPLPEWLLKLDAKKKEAKKKSKATASKKFALTHGTRKKFLPADEQDVLPEDYPEAAVEEPPQPVIEGPKDEDDISKLLHSSMFLRLDESRLPIETFDSLEFEEKDKLPEEWLATGLTTETGDVLGFAAYFVAGGKDEATWRWRKCKVLGYVEESKQYKVQMGQKIKLVSRLNLRFQAEDEKAWFRRRDCARAREAVKQQLGSTTSPTRAMKRAIVRQRYRNDPAFTDEYDSLKLPDGAVAPPPVAPRKAKVPLPPHPTPSGASSSPPAEKAKGWTSSSASSPLKRAAPPSLESALTGGDMAKDTRPGGLPFALPCAMEEFAAAQERHCRDFAATLRNDWRTAFAEQIVDNIQDVFDFFQSNAAVFEAGPLRRLLTHFELRMTNQLREVLLNSLDDWVGFIRRFTAQAADDAALEVPKLDSLEGVAPPLFRVMLQVSFPETERTSAPRIPG